MQFTVDHTHTHTQKKKKKKRFSKVFMAVKHPKMLYQDLAVTNLWCSNGTAVSVTYQPETSWCSV